MHTRISHHLLLLVFLLISNILFAQNYPVTCTPIVKPSFSLKWSEISTSTEMFKVHLLLKDLTKPSVDVYLKIRLSGVGVDIRTVDGFIPSKTILLHPGSAMLLTSADLAEYFNISNLVVDGIDISALYAGGRLPEGLYTWTVEAYEIDRHRQVSNTGMALMNVFKNYPPIINIPQEGAILPVTNPQNILFSWTSRSTASLNTAQGKTYKLRIYPLNAGEDPNMVANSGIQPIEITTTTPYFNYGAANIALEKGKRYAVQVQESDINGFDDYENEGKSQVVSFSFGKPCIAPEGLTINPIEKGRVELTWEQNDETSTTVWYKQSQSNVWNNLTVDGKSTVISNLKDKTAYEFKVSSNCGANTNAFGALDNSNPVIGGPSSDITEFLVDDSIFDEKLEELDRVAFHPAILDPFSIKVELLSDGTSIKPKSVADIFEKIIKPKCANNASSYEECSIDHPKIPIPTGEDLTSLAIGDVLGIYDFAVLVTEVSPKNAFSGKGLVKLPFLDDAFMAVEFAGIKIKKGEDGTHGGCVYEVPDTGYFRNRNIGQSELQNEQIKTIADIIKLTDPTIFHGDLEATLLKYKEKGEEIATKGTAIPQEKQDLLTYTKGIEVAINTWKDKFTETFSNESSPKLAEIMDDMKAIISQLKADKQTIDNGNAYPIIPHLKEKIDVIIEKIKALQEEQKPKLPKIQNVIVADITANESTIIWENDPRFTKYVVSYKTSSGGELIEITNSNRLDLKKLQENSLYKFKIEGYIGDKLVDTYTNEFTTLERKLPIPENVKITKIDKNTLTLAWDKNKLHKGYKLAYKDISGTEKFVPIDKGNTVTLKELDPEQVYQYELVAFGTNLTSDANSGSFTTCQTAASVLYYDRIQRKNVWSSKAISIIQGDGITLQLQGCNGAVTWKHDDELINETQPSICPSKSTTYIGLCKDGCEAMPLTINVNPPECTAAITASSEIVKTSIEDVHLTTSCTMASEYTNVSLKFINVNGISGEANNPSKIDSKTTFTLSCTGKYGGICGYNTAYTKTCQSEVTVDVYLPCENYFGTPFSVSSSKTNNIDIGEEITLTATGCPTTVTWNVGKTGNTIIEKPKKTFTYLALCSRSPLTSCGDIIKLTVNPFKIIVQPSKESYKIADELTLIAQGCADKVTWSTGETGQSIQVQPTETSTYEALCMGEKASQEIKIIKTVAPTLICEDFQPIASPSIVYKNENTPVKLLGQGCTNGTVTWKNKNTGEIIPNHSATDASIVLNTSAVFIATCKKIGFSPTEIEVTVGATLKNFQLTANKTQIPFGKTDLVTLNASGCVGGTVYWSDGNAQGEASRTLSVSPPQTFEAICKGDDFEASKTLTIKVQLIGSGAVLAGSTGNCPKNFGINFYKNSSDKKPYYGFPVVKPGQEIKVEVVGCSNPIWSWDNQFSANTVIKTKQNDRTTFYTVKCGSNCSAFIGVIAFDCEGWQNTTKEETWLINEQLDLKPNVPCPVVVNWYKNDGAGFSYYGVEENELGGIAIRVNNKPTTYKAVCSIDGTDCSLSYTIKPKVIAQTEASLASARTTNTCNETKVQLKQAMAGYIASLICADINLLKDTDGKISAEKVAIFLPKLESALNTIGSYKLPENKQEVINAILNGNIESCDYGNAAELLANTYEGEILIKDYNEKTKTSSDVNERIVKETIEEINDCLKVKPLWETDGHFSTVYLIALQLGMSDNEARKLAIATEDPDTDINFKNRDYTVDDTWSKGTLQKIYHTLNGGFHGVEEFLTAIGIMSTPTSDLKTLGFLIHRFGDTYAHTRLRSINPSDLKKLDIKGVNVEDGISEAEADILQKLMLSWQNVSSGMIENKVPEWMQLINEYVRKYGGNLDYGLVYKSSVWVNSRGERVKLSDFLIDVYKAYAQNPTKNGNLRLYGCSDCFMTWEHATVDKANADYIFIRGDWYLSYVKNLAALLKSKFNLSGQLNIGVFRRMVDYVTKNKCSMRGVIDVEIALHNKKNNIDIYKFLKNWQAHMIATAVITQESLDLQYQNDVNRTRDYLINVKNKEIVNETNSLGDFTRFIFHNKCK
ncbi:hypothetical protein [Emticicia sp. SJ17W-69]|uniref:hypothetical protein n=1 Tax=Emticicia sp. SJ17W-69 TaxID=3421657 RepID=UPI003EBA1973